MGLAGTALAWRRAAKVWALPQGPWLAFLALAAVTFVVVALAYAGKWVRHPGATPEVGSMELGWFSYGVGVVLWVALMPVLLHRVLLHDQVLPERLLPTVAIFAPPSVAMISWGGLTGDTSGPLPRVLWASAFMFGLILAAQIGRLRRIPFALRGERIRSG